jgi:hypothetical protein
MGWLIGWADRKSLVQHLCEDNGVKTVKRFFSGNDLWTVQETKTGDRFICLYKMVGGRNQDWGYKDIDEASGPFEETCPLSFFDMVPCPTYGYAVEFRERCKAAHARKQMPLVKGDVVRLTNGETYTISEVGRRLRGHDVHGQTFRIPRRMLVRKLANTVAILREAAVQTPLNSPEWNTLVHAASLAEKNETV